MAVVSELVLDTVELLLAARCFILTNPNCGLEMNLIFSFFPKIERREFALVKWGRTA